MAVTTPCVNKAQAKEKCLQDAIAIQNLQRQGHHVRDVSAWWSPSTMECHVIPIFEADKWYDVCNRYFDLFPKEAKETAAEILIEKQNFNKNGFSQDKNLMLMGKVPGGLRKALDIWHSDGDFWSDRALMRLFFSYYPKFKGAEPYGKKNSAIISNKPLDNLQG